MRIGNRSANSAVEISIVVPEGWHYKESFTLLAPDGQANVILSSEPIDQSITGDEYAAMQGDLLEREFPGYREISYEDFLLGEGSGTLRVFEWFPPDGHPVTQAQIYCVVVPGRGITSTATTPSTSFARYRTVLLDALRSITVASQTQTQLTAN